MTVTELLGLSIGCTLTALGFASIAVWTLRRRAAGRLPLLFGIWCVLYGVRLVAAQPPVQVTIGGTYRVWAYVIASITYTINVPTALFFETLIGVGWKQSIRRVRQVQIVYAVAAISIDLIVGRPYTAMRINNPLVLIGLVVEAVNVWLYRDRLGPLFKSVFVGLAGLVLLLAVANENLGRLFLPMVNLEPVGVLIFVVALAYAVIGRVVRGEAELLAVQRELETAREIQRSLLPREAPRARGLDVAVQFIPMATVAGDLYDFVDLGSSRTGILVADVSGHGIPAALVASMVKLAFSAQIDLAHDPARVLAGINAALCRQLERGFVTAVYVIVDTERGRITAANAGHPPLLIGRSNRSVVEVQERGLMLGFMPDASYTNAELELQTGDVILMYTDGVIEAQNSAGEFFDGERLRSWLTSSDEHDPRHLARIALADLSQWVGRSMFEDDITLVAARFVADSA